MNMRQLDQLHKHPMHFLIPECLWPSHRTGKPPSPPYWPTLASDWSSHSDEALSGHSAALPGAHTCIVGEEKQNNQLITNDLELPVKLPRFRNEFQEF